MGLEISNPLSQNSFRYALSRKVMKRGLQKIALVPVSLPRKFATLGFQWNTTTFYEGDRVHFRAALQNARIHMQIDMGFGDVVVPSAVAMEYPTFLTTVRHG
jgi:hypothetical protein